MLLQLETIEEHLIIKSAGCSTKPNKLLHVRERDTNTQVLTAMNIVHLVLNPAHQIQNLKHKVQGNRFSSLQRH